MRLLVNHMQGEIYINKIRYKRELRFECELKFRFGTHVTVYQ